MVGDMGLGFQLTTEQLCVLARRIVDYQPVDSRQKHLVCRDMRFDQHRFTADGEPEVANKRFGFYKPAQVNAIEWTSVRLKDRITVRKLRDGVWDAQYTGTAEATLLNSYFTHVLMLKPELDPEQAVKIRIELGVLKSGKNPRKRRTARLIAEQTLRNAPDALTAVKRLEPDIQKELDPLPYKLMLDGVDALKKSLALPKVA